MIDAKELQIRAELESETVIAWVEARWLRPRQAKEGTAFSEADIARAHFIRDLRNDLGVNDEGVGIILDLVDQIHGLRSALSKLSAAARAQPKSGEMPLGKSDLGD